MQSCNIRINNASVTSINKPKPSLSLNSTPAQPLKHNQKVQKNNNPINKIQRKAFLQQNKNICKQDNKNSVNKRIRCYSHNCTEQYNKNIPHTQTVCFLNKYFSHQSNLIKLSQFIDAILVQYQQLWGSENCQQIIEDFTQKIQQIFGYECVQIDYLLKITQQEGMIGLIFSIFKQIRQERSKESQINLKRSNQLKSLTDSFAQRLSDNENITNLKNIIQQFMESMYLCMEKDLYHQFNIQMKRIIIKYRQTSNIIRKINQRLNAHADIFELQAKMHYKQSYYKSKIKDLQQLVQRNEKIIEKHKNLLKSEKQAKQQLIQQNIKLQTKLDNCNDSLLKIALTKHSGPKCEDSTFCHSFDTEKQNYSYNIMNLNKIFKRNQELERGYNVKFHMDVNNIYKVNKQSETIHQPRYSLSRF